MTLPSHILAEVHRLTAAEIHPKVTALVQAFVAYLKEPRYLNPLTLAELLSLFQAFFADLNSLAIYIYTQLNTNKRQLLQRSDVFRERSAEFDYLGAIANYLSSSIKLVRRDDPQALYQLRVFAYYKFLTVLDTIEKAQVDLFSSGTADETLYDKIFRFDSRDIAIQSLLSEKLALLKNLLLPLSCFCDASSRDDFARVNEFFLTLNPADNALFRNVQAAFRLLNDARTPATKLKYIVKAQKLLLLLLSSLYDNDLSKVNNDILLPALIYTIIYHIDDYDLYLNFNFVKNFLNVLDPHSVDPSTFTLSTSLSNYNPTEKRRSFVRAERNLSSNFYGLLNLHAGDAPASDPSEFASDTVLINHLQATYLNNGELQYYLTNFEAILYFLLNTCISELVPEDFTIPEAYADDPLISLLLHGIIEQRENTEVETNEIPSDEMDRRVTEELSPNRSRSSSLFNTISSAMSHSVNRSRSNSGFRVGLNKEIFPHSTDFEASLSANANTYGLTRVRNLLGRIGLVSTLLFKPSPAEVEAVEVAELAEEEELETRTKRSQSLFDKLSPNHSRTRSGSLDIPALAPGSSVRRAGITSKFSSGVTEFMTKLSTAASTVPAPILELAHNSQTSLHSFDENLPFEDSSSRRPNLTKRSSSLQTMDRWFNNLAEGTSAANHQPTNSITSNQFTTVDSNYNDGSVFSASFGELTKYQHVDFDTLTIKDLKVLKSYYDQLCAEIVASKTDSKTSNEYLPEEKDQTSL